LRERAARDPVPAAVVNTVISAASKRRLRPLLQAMAMDLTTSQYETWEDLCGYGRLGGSDWRDDAARPGTDQPCREGAARALGLAFQLTNFLRDVDEDLDRGRIRCRRPTSEEVRRRSRRT
jgi:phytoene synthase